MVKQFEGDYAFDFTLFLTLLEKFGFCLDDVHRLEIEVLQQIDMAKLAEPSYYMKFSDCFSLNSIKDLSSQKFYSYIQNYILYLLVEHRFKTSIQFSCFAAAIIFYAASNDNESVHVIATAMKKRYSVNSTFLEKFDYVIRNTASNLKILGTQAEFLDSVVSKIDLRYIFN